MVKKLKENLASIAALIAAVVAIGGGFVKYGEITTRLNNIEANQGVDFAPIIKQIDETKDGVNGVANNVKENKESISYVRYRKRNHRSKTYGKKISKSIKWTKPLPEIKIN